MNSLISNIPRLGETKTKPKIGEIRLTTDGKRRKIFDGNCWQYLCAGDINCRIQSKLTCRLHKNSISTSPSLDKLSANKIDQLKLGDMQILPNGNRQIWRGTRWYNLCQAKNCSVQAKEFCKTHQNQRISLPNTNGSITEKFRLTARTRSCTLTTEKSEKKEHEAIQSSDDTISSEVLTNKRVRSYENLAETTNTTETTTTTTTPLEKPEVHTRNGRRVRCNGSIWKHLCADKKNVLYKRKYTRHSMPTKKADLIDETNPEESVTTELLPSDTTDSTVKTSPIPQSDKSKKRKLTDDINVREHIVPKRSSHAQKQKDSEKPIILHIEPNSSSASIFDSPTKDQSLDEPVLDDPEISFALKPNRLNTTFQSIEIPVQPPVPFNYDSSPASILEQFGTIIKKEAVVEEESLICVPTTYTNGTESSACETLQDFLRAEEMKTKEFKLDCQRISYRLAKIHDCIGSISSLTS
ncbi:hypothetical protein I4U23_007996 [Adineta vaga]|nr:hypothetical protein I4U23_007996 [Adineta vaga]